MFVGTEEDVSLILKNLFNKGLVKTISKIDVATNIAAWIGILAVKKLTTIDSRLANPNQKIKNPVVKISKIKNTPAAINQNDHIKITSIFIIQINYIILGKIYQLFAKKYCKKLRKMIKYKGHNIMYNGKKGIL